MIDLRRHLCTNHRTSSDINLVFEVFLSMIAGAMLMILVAALILRDDQGHVQFLFVLALTHGASLGALGLGRGNRDSNGVFSSVSIPINRSISLRKQWLIVLSVVLPILLYGDMWASGCFRSSPPDRYAFCLRHWFNGALISFFLTAFGQIQRGSQKHLSPISFGVFTGARVSAMTMLTGYLLYLVIAQPSWITSFHHIPGRNPDYSYTLGWEPVLILAGILPCLFAGWFLFIERDPPPPPIVPRGYRDPSHEGAIS